MAGFMYYLHFACWGISIILFLTLGMHVGRFCWHRTKSMFIVWWKVGFDSVGDRKYVYGPERETRVARAAQEVNWMMGQTKRGIWIAFAWIAFSGLLAALLVCFGLLFLVSETWFIIGGIIEIIVAVICLLYIHFEWEDFEICHSWKLKKKEYIFTKMRAWLFRIACVIAIIAAAFCIKLWF